MPIAIIRETLIEAIHRANRCQRDAAEALKRAPGVPSILAACLDTIQQTNDTLEQLRSAQDACDEIEERIENLRRDLDLNYRSRMLWRILATRCCFGTAGVHALKDACFHEILGQIPTEEALHAQLEECTKMLESRETAEGEFGPLRVIQIDKEFSCATSNPTAPTVTR